MSGDEGAVHSGPGGRGFYGAVTVSERGQIVVPAAARRDLGIRPGDKLLVLGDPEQGLALMTLQTLTRNLKGASSLLRAIEEDEARGAGDHGPG
jgi:AbrB family looped-hinge helix DNA binding protein